MFIFELIKTYIPPRSGKHDFFLKCEKKVSVSKKKNFSSPIPKLDLGFGSRYRNRILVSHYSFLLLFPDDTMMTRMMFAARKKGLMLLFFMVWIASVSANGIPPQVFIREPPDKTAVIGGQLPV